MGDIFKSTFAGRTSGKAMTTPVSEWLYFASKVTIAITIITVLLNRK